MSISCTPWRSAILTSFFFPHGDAVRPIALNFAWTERHCHACKTPRSMYSSIYNSFPVIRTTIAKNRHFYVPRPSIFCLPWGRPCGNHAKRCMNEKTIQCLANPTQLVPISLQQFPSYSNRKCKKLPFSRTAAHIFVSPGDALRLSRNMLHGWKDNSVLAKILACSMYQYLSSLVSELRCLSQCASPKIAIFTTFLFPPGTPLGQSR